METPRSFPRLNSLPSIPSVTKGGERCRGGVRAEHVAQYAAYNSKIWLKQSAPSFNKSSWTRGIVSASSAERGTPKSRLWRDRKNVSAISEKIFCYENPKYRSPELIEKNRDYRCLGMMRDHLEFCVGNAPSAPLRENWPSGKMQNELPGFNLLGRPGESLRVVYGGRSEWRVPLKHRLKVPACHKFLRR